MNSHCEDSWTPQKDPILGSWAEEKDKTIAK